MLYSLNYTQLRHFAQQLRERTGRHVKHSEILKEVAATKGEAYDATMHRLKHNPSVTIEFDDFDCFNLAQRLSTISGKMIEYNQVEINASDAVWLFTKDANLEERAQSNICAEIDTFGTVPTCFSFFPSNGSIRVSQKPEDQYGFSLSDLSSVQLALQAITELDDDEGGGVQRKSFDFEPFTLRACIVAKEHGEGVFTGLRRVDQLYKWLSNRYSYRLAIIPDGNVFHTPNSIPTLNQTWTSDAADGFTKMHGQYTPTIHPLIAKSVRPFSSSEATNAHTPVIEKLENAYETVQSIQFDKPELWGIKLQAAFEFLSELARHGPLQDDLKDFANQLYRLTSGLITLSKLHNLLASSTLENVDNRNTTQQVIEEMILIDKAKRRVGNARRREDLVKDFNGSVKTLKSLNAHYKVANSKPAVTLASWLDACHAIATSPLWTVFDDVLALTNKNAMTPFGGYRPRGWRSA